jgi:hypothetical protein
MEQQKPLKKYTKKSQSGVSRTFGVFICPSCDLDFHQRMDYAGKGTGLCKPCANISGGKARTTHGMNNKNSRLHCTWANMKRRCVNPTPKEKINYSHVSLCAEWMDFQPFMQWAIDNGYNDQLTIDRIDPKAGYHPGNCRFVGTSVQAANRRMTKKNTTGLMGVGFWDGRWRAKVTWRGKQIHLGGHETKERAAIARDDYIIENGLPHTLNYPDRDTRQMPKAGQ